MKLSSKQSSVTGLFFKMFSVLVGRLVGYLVTLLARQAYLVGKMGNFPMLRGAPALAVWIFEKKKETKKPRNRKKEKQRKKETSLFEQRCV